MFLDSIGVFDYRLPGVFHVVHTLGHYQPTSETSFEWSLTDGPTMVQFYILNVFISSLKASVLYLSTATTAVECLVSHREYLTYRDLYALSSL